MGIALIAMTGCDRAAPTGATDDRAIIPPAVMDRGSPDFEAAAATLAADRERLDAVRAACKADAPDATPALCEAAAEATRRRFRGSADSYRPHEVSAFPTEPSLPSGNAAAHDEEQ